LSIAGKPATKPLSAVRVDLSGKAHTSLWSYDERMANREWWVGRVRKQLLELPSLSTRGEVYKCRKECCRRHTWAGTRRATLVISPFNMAQDLAFKASHIDKAAEGEGAKSTKTVLGRPKAIKHLCRNIHNRGRFDKTFSTPGKGCQRGMRDGRRNKHPRPNRHGQG
jgi:hypothetical protein